MNGTNKCSRSQLTNDFGDYEDIPQREEGTETASFSSSAPLRGSKKPIGKMEPGGLSGPRHKEQQQSSETSMLRANDHEKVFNEISLFFYVNIFAQNS